MAESTNLLVTVVGGGFSVFVGVYTAWVGYRSKGKDQAHAQNNASYDNLQEDNATLRSALKESEARGDRYQKAFDVCEQARMDELTKFRDAMSADQFKRHELRSILRSALFKLEDNRIPYEDLSKRVKALDKL